MRGTRTPRPPSPLARFSMARGARMERSAPGILRGGELRAASHHIARLERDLQRSHAQAISSLLAALEAKDRYTHDHSIRVAGHVDRLARATQLSQAQIRVVRVAALLHDIGKIGVPDSILNKPGRLDSDEFAIMKRHSEIGADILRPYSFLAQEAVLVLRHHEWFDGRGYPGGLKADEIPLGARIVHVADSLDAMLSARDYRPSMDREQVVAELERGLGRQFDPDIGGAALCWLRNAPPESAAIN